ncbi:GNAT superfamily N-acetyltransferase [Crossiella equi]|uniref:GNAT superfamily N-acetyltransferase n=1 Tax=Crossiella equi TaxID=130796 RepID=A0ABS5A456_9PSEU|nr:GNAT family N-acetyltransferase [Crossiella equi]MBP2471313.1 GNAT superfamily N-acetyltransferase [Crossiella equi]
MVEQELDVAARAWQTAMAHFTEAVPGGFHRVGARGTAELISGVPLAMLNGVYCIAPTTDPDEVTDFVASPRLAGLPWSVQVRDEAAAAQVADVVAGLGFTRTAAQPFMTRELAEDSLPWPEPGPLRIRVVGGGEREVYERTLSAGYGLPREIAAPLTAPAVLDHPLMRAYVGEVDGVPVATSFGIVVDGLVGIFNVSVPPAHRRRGYGRALTAAAVRDGWSAGARTAFLHSSELGLPVYEEMGFAVRERWIAFTA